MRRSLSAAALLALLASPLALEAQGEPVKLTLGGPHSLTNTGVLRCDVGQEAQLGLSGYDSNMQASSLTQYAPMAESNNPAVLTAEVPEGSAHIVNVKCVGDGTGPSSR